MAIKDRESPGLRAVRTAVIVLGLIGLGSGAATEIEAQQLRQEGFNAHPSFAITDHGVFLGAVGNKPDVDERNLLDGSDAAWLQDSFWKPNYPQSPSVNIFGVPCGISGFTEVYQSGPNLWHGTQSKVVGVGCQWK